MEKLLYKENRIMHSSIGKTIDSAVYQTVGQIFGWVFLGMEFSKNINGQILRNPSIALTFLSNIRAIPDRLLPSFRLSGHHKDSAKVLLSEKKTTLFVYQLIKNYFCKLKIEFKNSVKLYQDLTIKCKLFLGRVNPQQIASR